MNEKNNKKSNSVLNQKNLTVIGITAVAVVLFAMIMTYIMPKSTENDKGFDSKAWKEAVSEADKNDVYQSSDDSDDYNRAAKPTTAEALPTQSEQAKAEPKSSDNATSDMNSESESTKTEDVKDNEQSQTRQSGDKIIIVFPNIPLSVIASTVPSAAARTSSPSFAAKSMPLCVLQSCIVFE